MHDWSSAAAEITLRFHCDHSTHALHLSACLSQADKKSRAEKAARDKAIRAGEQPAVVNDSGPISVAKPATLAGKSGDQAETRLQVRVEAFAHASL